jgi:transcription initiation factor TFIIIB Brf1 subunit/transcription initiation factor TFIIB
MSFIITRYYYTTSSTKIHNYYARGKWHSDINKATKYQTLGKASKKYHEMLEARGVDNGHDANIEIIYKGVSANFDMLPMPKEVS